MNICLLGGRKGGGAGFRRGAVDDRDVYRGRGHDAHVQKHQAHVPHRPARSACSALSPGGGHRRVHRVPG